jgi:hypothetical protein
METSSIFNEHRTMKKVFPSQFSLLFAVLLAIPGISHAQDNPANRASPPATTDGAIHGAKITINYGSPSVKGRKIWGELVPFDEVWRAGANEATTFETDKPLTVQGKTLPAGKYAFFAIPGKKKWTIIFNTVPDQWGAFKYDQTKDALRVTVKPKKTDQIQERLRYEVNARGIALRWEYLEIPVNIQ